LAEYEGYRQQGCWLNIRGIDSRAFGTVSGIWTPGLLAEYEGYRQQGCWLNIRDIDSRAVG
jgi:hypothetical protein